MKTFVRKIYASAPLILMVAVAVSQMVFSQFYGLARWKGGGFGMFATIDKPNNRFVHVHLLQDERFYCATPPTDMDTLIQKAANFPIMPNLKRLASGLAGQRWVLSPETSETAVRPLNSFEPFSQEDLVEYSAVGITVFQGRFHRDTMVYEPVAIKEATLSVNADGPDKN